MTVRVKRNKSKPRKRWSDGIEGDTTVIWCVRAIGGRPDGVQRRRDVKAGIKARVKKKIYYSEWNKHK